MGSIAEVRKGQAVSWIAGVIDETEAEERGSLPCGLETEVEMVTQTCFEMLG